MRHISNDMAYPASIAASAFQSTKSKKSKKAKRPQLLLQERIRFKPFTDKYHFIATNESGQVKLCYKDSFISHRNGILSQLKGKMINRDDKMHLKITLYMKAGFKGTNLHALFIILEQGLFMSMSQIACLEIEYKNGIDPDFAIMDLKVTQI